MKGLICLMAVTLGGEAHSPVLHGRFNHPESLDLPMPPVGFHNSLIQESEHLEGYPSMASFFRPRVHGKHGHESLMPHQNIDGSMHEGLARNAAGKLRGAANTPALNSTSNGSVSAFTAADADSEFERSSTFAEAEAESVFGSGNMTVADAYDGLEDVSEGNSTLNVTWTKYTKRCRQSCNWCFKEFHTHCFAKCYRGCWKHCNHWDRVANCSLRTVWFAVPHLHPKVNNPNYFVCQSKGKDRCPT